MKRKNYVTLVKISLPHVTCNDIIAPRSLTFYLIGTFSPGLNSPLLSCQLRQKNTKQNFTNQAMTTKHFVVKQMV